MTEFGKTLFSGSRFIFRALAPVIFIFLISMTLYITEWNRNTVVIITAFWITAISLILGMLNPIRFGWAFRIVSGMIFMAFAVYLIVTLIEHGWKLSIPRSRAEDSPVNAILGLLLIGGPALMYTIRGRFTLRKENQQTFEKDEIENDR